MIKAVLHDLDTGETQSIDKDGATLNIVKPVPPFASEATQKMRPFRQYLTDNGTDTGDNDMLVDGSSTNVEFYVSALSDKDLYITQMSWVIADINSSLNNFGNVSALTNGCQLEYEDEAGTVVIHEALKSNFDVVRLTLGNPAFGTGADAFQAGNVGGTGGLSEGYIPVLDVRDVFGFQWGILLRAGTEQRLVFRIRDDVTGIDQLDCIAYGFTRAKD